MKQCGTYVHTYVGTQFTNNHYILTSQVQTCRCEQLMEQVIKELLCTFIEHTCTYLPHTYVCTYIRTYVAGPHLCITLYVHPKLWDVRHKYTHIRTYVRVTPARCPIEWLYTHTHTHTTSWHVKQQHHH